jgi:hypothetical protein
MNPLRRSFLKLFGGAALSVPTKAFAQPIRILPDGDTVKPAPIAGQASPELHRTLGAVVPGPATTQGALSTIWLEAAEGRPPAQILTLDEARAASALTVTERAQASVPELIADNHGKSYVLLLAGEIPIGGKQNRVLREDLLLPPFSGPRNIGVYCVEQGRWNEGRKDFESRSSVVQPSVRSEVIGKAPQSRIWSGVAAASRTAGFVAHRQLSGDLRQARGPRASRYRHPPAGSGLGAANDRRRHLRGIPVRRGGLLRLPPPLRA